MVDLIINQDVADFTTLSVLETTLGNINVNFVQFPYIKH